MNDRSKFKVWDKEKKVWLEHVFIDSNGMPCFSPTHNILINLNDGVDVVWCTGRKDKNGKLIFEGNIIKSTQDGEISKFNSDTGIGLVQWLDEYAVWYITQGIENALGDIIALTECEVEIIGSIQENPERLKTNQGKAT